MTIDALIRPNVIVASDSDRALAYIEIQKMLALFFVFIIAIARRVGRDRVVMNKCRMAAEIKQKWLLLIGKMNRGGRFCYSAAVIIFGLICFFNILFGRCFWWVRVRLVAVGFLNGKTIGEIFQ